MVPCESIASELAKPAVAPSGSTRKPGSVAAATEEEKRRERSRPESDFIRWRNRKNDSCQRGMQPRHEAFLDTTRGGIDNAPLFDAGWSSLVARWAHNPKVAGSNPVPATNR